MTNIKETKIYSPKKLIEVALPLDDINVAAAREKSIRHGHPSTLHLWWARRPLAAARAVIFAQMVNDPGYQQDGGFKYGVNKKEAEIKREKLFQIIRDLVKWENTNNEDVLNCARGAIKESWQETCHLNRNHPQAAELFNPKKLPAFHDPFAGGGAIPLEAQRLGLESYASDLNPVAVMINKAMIEIPPKFVGQAPIGPLPEAEKQQNLVEDCNGVKGLAEDVRRYGRWIRDEAKSEIGHLYPDIVVTQDMIIVQSELKNLNGKSLKPVAWIWSRTIKNPNPAFSGNTIPLSKSFALSTKNGKCAWIEVVKSDNEDGYTFIVKTGPSIPTQWKKGSVGRKGAQCLLTGTTVALAEIRSAGKNGLLSEKLMAIVAEGPTGRVFLNPLKSQEDAVNDIHVADMTSLPIDHWSGRTNSVAYGLDSFEKLYSSRQAMALNCFVGLMNRLSNKIMSDLSISSIQRDEKEKEQYLTAVITYIAFAIDKMADRGSTICTWDSSRDSLRNTFGRHAIPMTWDFAEANPFSNSTGNFLSGVDWGVRFLKAQSPKNQGHAYQGSATSSTSFPENSVISSDPPYYDNVPYSNVSEYFYYWMRKSLKKYYPDLFGTITVPKSEELVANQFRHGGKENAEKFFMSGMTSAMEKMNEKSHPIFPVTIYYAFKQSETTKDETVSAGWESFLEAVIAAGFLIDGTWPMSTEMSSRLIGSRSNALASSVVLVCKPCEIDAGSISRREFQRELRENMPEALEAMIGGETGTTPIAPVDLAQAAIGPGMAIYSKYAAVLNQDGSKMSVHDALILINRAITNYLYPDSGNFDADTLFCGDWFSQCGWGEGQFGEANVLAQAKGTSVDGVRDAGVIEAGSGKVRLLKWNEYPQDWDPKTDTRTPIWEACHHMIRVLNQQGESEAGALLARMPERGEPIRQLAYHLYTQCERKQWADDARVYNELVGSWHAIVSASHEVGHKGTQLELGLDF